MKLIVNCLARREVYGTWNKNAGCKAAALKRLTLMSTARRFALPLCAQVQDWTNATSQNELNAGSWNPGHVPAAADDVKVKNSSNNMQAGLNGLVSRPA